MTVGELIKKLRNYPKDTPVYVDDDGRLRDPWPSYDRVYQYGERDDLGRWKLCL